MPTPEHTAQRFETQFERIQRERMEGIPLLHDALSVRAIGFREFEEHHLGVLLTPWFMNLILCPVEPPEPIEPGTTEVWSLPSGDYEFIAACEDELGAYYMCSLMSPVFEFADQEAAEDTARQVMTQIMTPPEDDADNKASNAAVSRRDLLRGRVRDAEARPS